MSICIAGGALHCFGAMGVADGIGVKVVLAPRLCEGLGADATDDSDAGFVAGTVVVALTVGDDGAVVIGSAEVEQAVTAIVNIKTRLKTNQYLS